MGVTSSKPNPTGSLPYGLQFSAAGILFFNDTHVLAGYQPHKNPPCITGIGGCKEEGETELQTAWRETVEELFDCKDVPKEFIETCITQFIPKFWFSHKDYVCFYYSFQDLECFLRLAKRHRISSAVYETIPTNLFDLVFKRTYSETAELASLCILPIVNNRNGILTIHDDFCSDMCSMSLLPKSSR